MNKKGFSAMLFMVGIVIIILALGLASPLTTNATSVQNGTLLDCFNSSISNDNKIVCTQIDSATPIIVLLLLGLGSAFLWGSVQ